MDTTFVSSYCVPSHAGVGAALNAMYHTWISILTNVSKALAGVRTTQLAIYLNITVVSNYRGLEINSSHRSTQIPN